MIDPTENRVSASSVTRRSFLRYVGTGGASLLTAHVLGPLTRTVQAREIHGAIKESWSALAGTGRPDWTPVSYPIPIASDGGSAATDAARLAKYVVGDDVLLPAGFRYDVVATWGDRFGPPGHTITFGHSNDYTGIVPIAGKADEFWMLVNHEYISARPWLEGYSSIFGQSPVDSEGKIGGARLSGCDLNLADPALTQNMNPVLLAGARELCRVALSDLGVSVLRVRRSADGRFSVVTNSLDHFRFTGDGAQNARVQDMSFTGPAANRLGVPRGTFSNCSGATTPWGTFLSCEENFQDQVPEFIAPDGQPLPEHSINFNGNADKIDHPYPFEFSGLGAGVFPPLDGRQYGWVIEVDPVRRTLKKHTALGRFRHENVALRCEAGKRLVAYMGDDRRGGHVWKFVSEGVVTDPTDPANSALLERGTLYVARFEINGEQRSGSWVALDPHTPLRMPEPQQCADGRVWLPSRPDGGHVQVGEQAGPGVLSVTEWNATATRFAGGDASQLMSLVDPPDGVATLDARNAHATGVLCMDAYVMANAIGGTPCSRPEDIEVHPRDGSIYIAFTDSTGSDDGSPDARIFPDSRRDNSRQYGAIYRLAETNGDAASLTFTWGRFIEAGEMAEQGQSFACADNLVFDPFDNLWMVTDITTPLHNNATDRTGTTAPGAKGFVGVFGNNALFMIPTSGPSAGVPHCFAIGPMESEMTGPTFTPDGRTLLLAVQHPGELHGARRATIDRADEVRHVQLATRDGSATFTQHRTTPLGSNFPSRIPNTPPKPCVIAITRQA